MRPSLRIVATASGGGRTVANLLDRIERGSLDAEIRVVVTDRPCSAEERLRARGLTVERVAGASGMTPQEYASLFWARVEPLAPDLVCHCGFLRLLWIPPAWENRVLNIHPGLLPRFGGKGMYGDRVHRAVLESGVAESGCTVHIANNEYDRGPILVQRRVPVLPGDSVESLAARVFEAECEAYPEAIRLFAEGRLRVRDGKVSIR